MLPLAVSVICDLSSARGSEKRTDAAYMIAGEGCKAGGSRM
jgi:hypothetical protein